MFCTSCCFRLYRSRVFYRHNVIPVLRYTNTRVTEHHGNSKEMNFTDLVSELSNAQREQLEVALREYNDNTNCSSQEETVSVTSHQLKLVLLQSGLPFVGFGFLDNVIMIIAGEYIDMTIGVTLGISTMAAAAIGNLISDLFGLGLADTVESLCRRLGVPNPDLSLSQFHLPSVRWAQRLGRVFGVTVGCIIGMAPLLWFDNDTESHHHDNEGNSKQEN